MHRGGLHKRSVHRLHGLATILSVMPGRRARQRIAALHRLFRRRRGATVEGVPRESDCQHCQQDGLN
jgi:hypothetical protein